MSRDTARLVEQYKGDPLIAGLIDALSTDPNNGLEEEAKALLLRLSIDAMEGVNLDVIGKFLGFPRPPSFEAEADYLATVFTLSPTSTRVTGDFAQGLADADEPLIGGTIIQDQTFLSMPDAQYRRFLKAAIIRNNSKKTWEDIQEVTKILYSVAQPVDISTVGEVTVTTPTALNPQAEFTTRQVMPVADGINLILQEAA